MLLLLFEVDLLNKLVFLFVCLLIVETFPPLSVPGFTVLFERIGLLYFLALLFVRTTLLLVVGLTVVLVLVICFLIELPLTFPALLMLPPIELPLYIFEL